MKYLYLLLITLMLIFSCQSFSGEGKMAFQETVDYVEIDRFTGDWYVIALIPTIFEKKAVNGVENYQISDEGVVLVTYTFLKGSLEGKEKTMYQKGYIYDNTSNSDWRVSPLWPFKLPYYILEIAPDYSYTVIGTNNYKYLWIMAREPEIDSDTLGEIYDRMEQRGYEREKIIMMEQMWEM